MASDAAKRLSLLASCKRLVATLPEGIDWAAAEIALGQEASAQEILAALIRTTNELRRGFSAVQSDTQEALAHEAARLAEEQAAQRVCGVCGCPVTAEIASPASEGGWWCDEHVPF